MMEKIQTQAVLFWIMVIVVVGYIAGIGIPAIEELKARSATETTLTARHVVLLQQLANDQKLSADERDRLRKEASSLDMLQQRLTTLNLVGSRASSKTFPGTLSEIECAVAALRDTKAACTANEEHSWPATLVLKSIDTHAASGAILAVLIVTAAVGGALVRLSLVDEPGAARISRTLLRSVGGGIVCYLVLRGEELPSAFGDVVRYSNPASASLAGFLSGMFSNRIFQLLSVLVEALVKKVTPELGQSDLAEQDSHADAE